MTYKADSSARTPDAGPEKHRCVIETSRYKLFVVLVKDQDRAVKVRKEFAKEEGIHSILRGTLLPYSHFVRVR